MKTPSSETVEHVTKLVLNNLVGFGAGYVVKNATNNLIPQNKWYQKVLVKAGLFGISGIVGQASARHTEEQISSVFVLYRENKSLVDDVVEAKLTH